MEIWEDFRWSPIGSWEPAAGGESRGFAGKGVWRYGMDYCLAHLHEPTAGASLALSMSLDSIALPHWPAFLLDLLPGGPARDQWLELLRLSNGPAADLPLLLHAGRAPVGNLRIARGLDTRIPRAHGFSRAELLEQQEQFLAYMSDALVAQGLRRDTPYSAADSQGTAPKYLLTQDRDGLWWAEGTLADARCAQFWLVKFPRGKKTERDRLVLRAEAAYYQVAWQCGVRVGDKPLLESDILFLPRFDREVTAGGRVRRHGLETLCSALGVAEFGHAFHHEELCGAIARYSSQPCEDLLEYLHRDILNLALANSDNHARNTSFLKKKNRVTLSPLYDFAPMELDPEGNPRATLWQDERLLAPPWERIAKRLGEWRVPLEDVRKLYRDMAEKIRAMETLCVNAGVPDEVVQYCRPRWPGFAQQLEEAAA